MRTQLPKLYRPQCSFYRRCVPGLDIPSIFFDNLQGIDENLYLVWHQYKLLWDNIINDVPGRIEDSRYTINVDYGHLNFGFVLIDRLGKPLLEQTEFDQDHNPHNFGAWHIWRLCKPVGGWAHILKLESTNGEYLSLVLNRLHLQARWSDRYGAKSYNRLLESNDEKEREAAMKDRQEMMTAFQEENRWFLRKAMNNFNSKIVAPTNPTREIITSFSGQSNKSKIVRPITDKEAGLWNPDGN
jgi:hypothetical protein